MFVSVRIVIVVLRVGLLLEVTCASVVCVLLGVTTSHTQLVIAAEKLKREKWVAEQAARVKELTIKGLEPEVQRILTAHKAQLQAVQREAADTLDRERARHAEELRRLGGDTSETHAKYYVHVLMLICQRTSAAARALRA